MERLHKYLARCGVASRRKAETMIADGQILVNGEIVRQLGLIIDPDNDLIEYRNERIKPPLAMHYYLLNKPKGVLTTLNDPHNRPSIADLIPPKLGLFPVGRLDFLSEGLLLITNDGELAYRLTHPKFKIEKKYIVAVRGRVAAPEIETLRNGVALEKGQLTLPLKARVLSESSDSATLEIIIREGKKRQLRRMCVAIGHPVLELKRTAIGPLELADLPIAAIRSLTESETFLLKSLCGLA